MPQPAASHKPDPAHRGARTPLRVGVILADHFTLSAFAVFIDHLRLAADEGDRSRPMHGQWWVMREVAAAGVPLIGVCTGSFILCRAGLMKGRRTCVSWYHYQDFLEAFPDHEVVADRLFLADGPRITCAGGAGAAALATHLIELHLGRAVAQKASQVLLFDRPRSGSDTQPHPPLPETVHEPRVRRALLLMEQNLARPVAIATIAQELGVSVRQLERLCREQVGVAPASLYRQLRMRYAHWLIDNTDRSVTEIAIEAGFADCAHFSRQFKDAYGLSPSTRRLQPARSMVGEAAGARVYD